MKSNEELAAMFDLDPRDLEGTWRCSRCGTSKPESHFHRKRTRYSGRQPWCKECQREYFADEDVRARRAELQRAYRQREE